MTETTVKSKVIGNALIWAAMMIASSLLIGAHENSQTLMLLFIAGWFATNGLVTERGNLMRAECNALRRMVGKDPKE